MFANNSNINVIKTYVESKETFNSEIITDLELDDLNKLHFDIRHNTEYDFFSDIINNIPWNSNCR